MLYEEKGRSLGKDLPRGAFYMSIRGSYKGILDEKNLVGKETEQKKKMKRRGGRERGLGNNDAAGEKLGGYRK